ncbi:hypothetical protein STEG23_033911, partial [Scotinomys teguina]
QHGKRVKIQRVDFLLTRSQLSGDFSSLHRHPKETPVLNANTYGKSTGKQRDED